MADDGDYDVDERCDLLGSLYCKGNLQLTVAVAAVSVIAVSILLEALH